MLLPASLVDLEAFYQRCFGNLTEIALTEFEMPHDVAEEIAHQVLLASIQQTLRAEAVDEWLAGSLRTAVGHYQKSNDVR